MKLNSTRYPKKLVPDVSRRDFFIKTTLASVAMTLPAFIVNSCKDEAIYLGSGKAPFKVWEEMLKAITTSSDYLPERMEELIASKDLKAMYHFVKDEIALIPPKRLSLNGIGELFKWGIHGVLRCGMATPREKVELLNLMYQKAGIENKVVYEKTNIKPKEVPAFFYRPIVRNFNPRVSKKQFNSWKNEMGYTEETLKQIEIQKDYTKDANALGNTIIKQINSFDKHAQAFDFRWDNFRTPTLEFTENGKTKYAHLFDPKIKFGELKNDMRGETTPAESFKENKEEISLKLSYRTNIKPLKELDMISGSWKATDLIGKQILINFSHGLSIDEQAITPIGNLRTYTPSLALQAINETKEYTSERSFLGNPITIDGKRIELDKKGNISINGNTLLSKTQPDLQKKVASLDVSASVAGFPIVKINVTAKNSSGDFVEGLSTKDFLIYEDDKLVSALMENNQRTPKILVLSDASLSMPTEYLGEGMVAFNNTLKKDILKKYPAAHVTFWETPSSLFTWLLKASQTSYDLIIYATDGHNDDAYNEKNHSLYKAGPPALIINVRNSKFPFYIESFNKMAEITGGKVIDVQNQVEVISEVTNYIDTLEIPPYVFTYFSSDTSKNHTVKVGIDTNRIEEEDSYQFPKTEKIKRNGIIGVYLEISVGKNKPIKRVLAGWDIKNNKYNPEKEYILNVESLFLGNAILSIEGEGPTLSMSLSEMLKSKLSNRDWGEAFQVGDIPKAKEKIEKGILTYPISLVSLMAPIQNQITDKSLTFPSGYRMCLQKNSIGLETTKTELSFDYLPTSKYVTLADNKIKAFKTTLSKTAQLAIRENALFDQSTYSLLNKKELVERLNQNKEDWKKITGIDSKHPNSKYWNEAIFRGDLTYKIFDRQAKTKAFWKIDQYSGEIYGMLPNNTGGGLYQHDSILRYLSSVLEGYKQIIRTGGVSAAMSGQASFASPMTLVTLFALSVVKRFAYATIAINIMDGNTIKDEEIRKAFQILACKVALEIPEKLPGKKGLMPGVDRLIGLITDNNLACEL